jgi:hypothetical protein
MTHPNRSMSAPCSWSRRPALLVLAVAVATALVGTAPTPVAAEAPIVVTTTDDVVDADDDVLSLREAFTVARNDGVASTISLASDATYALTMCEGFDPGHLSDTSGEGLVLEGAGATIRQTCDGSVLYVSGGDVVIRDVTVADGNRAAAGCCAGGAFLASIDGDVLVEGVAFRNNRNADGSGGGGLFASAPQGTVTLRRVVATGNESTYAGGGMRLVASAVVEDTALVGNTAGGSGGGLMVDGPATLRNVTIAGNQALAAGAARLFNTADLRNVTIAGNTSPDGQLRVSQNLTVAGTVFADAAAGQVHCLDPIVTSLGSNYSTDSSCDLGTGDVEDGADPDLRPPFANGGDTVTAYPSKGSPLLDAIDASDAELLPADQRGVARVQGAGGDIGAVEVRPCAGRFGDVSAAHAFCWEIGWLADAGVTAGVPGGGFVPGQAVTRGSMAAFLHRLAGSPPIEVPASPSFSDVPASHPFFAEVEWLADTGVTSGFPDGTFGPGQPVTRGSMAAFLHRLAGSPVTELPAGPSFSDVPTTHPFFGQVEWLADTGVTSGFPDGTFGPGQPVTRGSMAAFLYRFVDGQEVAV